MAGGILSLLREIFADKLAAIDRDYYNRCEELERSRNKLVPSKLDAKADAEKKLRKEYFELRAKATLDSIPKEKIKKLVEDFQSKDYLAEAMGV